MYYKLGQVLQIRAIITNWGITLEDHLLNTVKELKNLEKLIISNIYIEMNQTKLVIAHDGAYFDSKDLGKITISDKIL